MIQASWAALIVLGVVDALLFSLGGMHGRVQSSDTATDTHNECITGRTEASEAGARRQRGGLIIMIAVGRGDIAIAKHSSKNDVNGHFINIQPRQYFAQIQSHYVKCPD